ncbi:MAG: hypothetical protein IJZ35_03380 [Clostridia bacterium]|nr:hypothetical protein [Clostridia bacterium]
MDNMLKEILRAEREAKAFADEAERYKIQITQEIEAEKNRIKEEKAAQAKSEAERLRLEHKQSVADSMKADAAESEAEISRLRSLAKDMSAQWEDEIFRRTVSV